MPPRLVGLLFVLVALCACASPAIVAETPSPSPVVQSGGVLRIALFSDVDSIDPVAVSSADGLLVSRQVYETLVDLEPGGFRIVPRIAEAWTVSADGLVWTFALRRGVKFHDGSDLDAAGVVASLERARRAGRDASVISAIGPRGALSVAITTRAPYGPLLALLATGGLAITGATADIGSGPFALAPGAHGRGAQLMLERSATFWERDRVGARLPYLDRIVFRTVRDESARVAELRGGSLDLVRDLSLTQLATVKSDPNLVAETRPARALAYLGISLTGGTLERIELRRAIASAIDRSRLASPLYAPDLHVASQLVPPGMLGYDDSVVDVRYDVSAAKRAMAQAGFAGVSLDLWFPAAWTAELPEPRRVADGIVMDLAKIGVQVTLRSGETATYREGARANRFALWLDVASADLADPDAYLGADEPRSPIAAELLRRARVETDPSKRGELYKQVTKLIQQEVSRVPLFTADGHLALGGKVRGFEAQPVGADSLTAVWIGK